MIQEEEISSAAEQETFASWQTMLMTIFHRLTPFACLCSSIKTRHVVYEWNRSSRNARARARERVREKKNQRSTLHCLLKIKMQSWDMYLKQVVFSFLRRRLLLLITTEKSGDIKVCNDRKWLLLHCRSRTTKCLILNIPQGKKLLLQVLINNRSLRHAHTEQHSGQSTFAKGREKTIDWEQTMFSTASNTDKNRTSP